jgi:hypothetical protein
VDGNPVANVKILQDATKLLAIMKDGQPRIRRSPRGRNGK